MTEMPPGRPSEPRTGRPAPAPAHGDGPTGPSTPTGRTESVRWNVCPDCLGRHPDGSSCAPDPRSPTMPEPADRPPSLRDRIADALHCPTCGVEPGAHCLRARVDNRQPHMTRVQAADAVMPVVEAETAALRQRAEEAERALAQARDAIADERRARLAAEAAVRRGRATLNSAKRCQDSLDPSERMQCAMCGGDHLAEALEALDAEQPKETP